MRNNWFVMWQYYSSWVSLVTIKTKSNKMQNKIPSYANKEHKKIILFKLVDLIKHFSIDSSNKFIT